MILVTGASGTVGRAVLAEVARSGRAHRAMYRSREEAAKAPAGTETVLADFLDRASLAAALRDILRRLGGGRDRDAQVKRTSGPTRSTTRYAGIRAA